MGRMHNIADEDTVIRSVWSDGKAETETPLTLNLKNNLNDPSPHCNEGLHFLDEDHSESDDESVGQERTFGNNATNETEAQEALLDDPVEQASASRDQREIAIASHNVVQNSRPVEQETGTMRLQFDRMSSTPRLRKHILKRAFERAEDHWRLKGKTWFKVRVKNEPRTMRMFCDFGYWGAAEQTAQNVRPETVWMVKLLTPEEEIQEEEQNVEEI